MRSKENKKETEIYIDIFDDMIGKLVYPERDNDGDAEKCLEIIQYYLLNIIPGYEGFIREYIENETEYRSRHYSNFLFHMGRLAMFIEMGKYWEAFGEIEHLYAFSNGKETFFQPKYVYNIVKILSHMGGKRQMLQRKEDEMSFKDMAELVNKKSSEFQYVESKVKKLSVIEEKSKENDYKEEIFRHKQEEQYRESWDCICDMFEYTKSNRHPDWCDKLVLVDYLMDIIKNDLKYDCFANVIYRKEQSKLCLGVPGKYYDSNGNECVLKRKEKAVEVDFSKVLTFSFPWNQRRIPDNLARFAVEDFKYFENNHDSVYFPQFNMCVAYGGNHSIAMGVKNNQGKIMSDVIDIEPLFGNIDTDGVYWYSVYDRNWLTARDEYKERNKLGRLSDFRFGLLFKLAEAKYNIEKES